MYRRTRHLWVLLCFLISSDFAASQRKKCARLPPNSRLLPFGPCEGDDLLTLEDDRSAWINLKETIMYFNRNFTKIFVNANGALSFTEDVYMANPVELKGKTTILAVFWADADTRFDGGNVYVGQQTSGKRLKRAEEEVKKIMPTITFQAKIILVTTWSDVTFFGASVEGRKKRNTFQAVLVADATRTFIFYRYDKLDWSSGTANGGNRGTGLGEKVAQVGYDAGDLVHAFMVPNVEMDIRDVINATNVAGPFSDAFKGIWFFELNPVCAPTAPPARPNKPKPPKCLKKGTCCLSNGNTYTAGPNCQGYYQLPGSKDRKKGEGYLFPCSGGLYFNVDPKVCTCDWARNVKCAA